MPPQTRAATRRRAAPTPLDTLPLPLALRIFALLPVDARLLAAAVCRSWRAMLADPALWTRLDLFASSGVRNPTFALLRAAAARAGGQLEVLRVSLSYHEPHDELISVLTANAGTIRDLVLSTDDEDTRPRSEVVAELLRAAPGLHSLETGMSCMPENALPVLRKEPPFGPLRLKSLNLFSAVDVGWRAVADGLTAHSSLKQVDLRVDWPAAQAESDAVVGALLSLPQLCSLSLGHTPAAELARLLGSPTLESVSVSGSLGMSLLDSPASTALLCDALRANSQLVKLTLFSVDLWRDMGAAAALLAALQAHSSLRSLALCGNQPSVLQPESSAAAGAALGGLIAHSQSLSVLDIDGCRMFDDGMGPIVDALPRARRLRTLLCRDNRISEDFARQRLLPAVRACAPLRTLEANDSMYGGGPPVHSPAMNEARELLRQRRRARSAHARRR